MFICTIFLPQFTFDIGIGINIFIGKEKCQYYLHIFLLLKFQLFTTPKFPGSVELRNSVRRVLNCMWCSVLYEVLICFLTFCHSASFSQFWYLLPTSSWFLFLATDCPSVDPLPVFGYCCQPNSLISHGPSHLLTLFF